MSPKFSERSNSVSILFLHSELLLRSKAANNRISRFEFVCRICESFLSKSGGGRAIDRSSERHSDLNCDREGDDTLLQLLLMMENPNQLRRSIHKRHSLFLFIACVLLTIVFMAIPRASNQGAAYFAKQVYYNHGEGRDPHLGQRPRIVQSRSQSKSRRLMDTTKVSFQDDTSGKLDNH